MELNFVKLIFESLNDHTPKYSGSAQFEFKNVSKAIYIVTRNPHGLTNAVILPAVLRYNYPNIKGKVKYLARACGADSEDFNGLMT